MPDWINTENIFICLKYLPYLAGLFGGIRLIKGLVTRARLISRFITEANLGLLYNEIEKTSISLKMTDPPALEYIIGPDLSSRLPDFIPGFWNLNHYEAFFESQNSASRMIGFIEQINKPTLAYTIKAIVQDLALLLVIYRRKELIKREYEVNRHLREQSKQELARIGEDSGRVRNHLSQLLSQYGSLALNPSLSKEMYSHHFDMEDFKGKEEELKELVNNPYFDPCSLNDLIDQPVRELAE